MTRRIHSFLALMITFSVVLSSCASTGAGDAPAASGGDALAPGSSEDLAAPVPAEPPAAPATASDGPLTATADSGISVQLEWTPIDGAEGYDLEFSMGGEERLLLASLDDSATSYEDFGVPEGVPLMYHLTARGTGDSFAATVATEIAPANPYSVEPVLEGPSVNIGGFDPTTMDAERFDPSTLDFSNLDPSLLTEENFDPSAFIQQAGTSAEIGPEGGEIVVQAKTGITYRLSIPEGALEAPTYIVMTPIETINGYPFSGEVYGAVQIEPEGIELREPARLTIEPPDAAEAPSVDENLTDVAFAFRTGGDNFHLTPFALGLQASGQTEGGARHARPAERPLRAGPLAEIAAKQLESYGVGQATPAEVRSFVKKHPPSGAKNRAVQKLAGGQAKKPPREELAPLPSRADLEVGRIRLQAARATSCREFAAAFQAYQALNMSSTAKEASAEAHLKVVDALADSAQSVLTRESKKCLSPRACAMALAQSLTSPETAMQEAVSKAFRQRHSSDFARLDELVKACKLELIIDSTMVLTVPLAGTQSVMVTSKIPLKWEYDASLDMEFLKGIGPVIYVDIGMGIPDCKVTFPSPPPTKFDVQLLRPSFDKDDRLTDFNLADWAVPGNPNIIKMTCKELTGKSNNPWRWVTHFSQLGGGTCDIWCGYFIAARGFVREVESWVVKEGTQGPGIVAEKAVSQDVFVPSFDGTLSEKTVFTIRRVK